MKRRYIGPVDELDIEAIRKMEKETYEKEMKDDEIRPLLEEKVQILKNNKLPYETDEIGKWLLEKEIKCPISTARCPREMKIEYYKLEIQYLKGEITGKELHEAWMPKYWEYTSKHN